VIGGKRHLLATTGNWRRFYQSFSRWFCPATGGNQCSRYLRSCRERETECI